MRRITALLAVTVAAAAAVPTAASAGMPSYAGEKPSNYGSCVAYEAMAGLDPVSDFTGRTSPLTIFGSEGEKIVGPNPGLDETTMSCLIDFGRGQDPVTRARAPDGSAGGDGEARGSEREPPPRRRARAGHRASSAPEA